jgi:hypothetical protein
VPNPDADVVQKIDDVTRGSENDDIGFLETQLRLALPGNAFFGRKIPLPDGVKKIAEKLGVPIVADGSVPVEVKAAWTFPDAIWMTTFRRCADVEAEVYHVSLNGPETDLSRDHISADEVINLFRAVGAINS